MSMSLKQIGHKYSCDRATHQYLDTYEIYFGTLPSSGITLVELNTKGRSLANAQVWLDFFRTARVIVVDDTAFPAWFVHDRLTTHVIKNVGPAQLKKILSKVQADVVIDNLLRTAAGTRAIHSITKPGGLIIVEGLTCYDEASKVAGKYEHEIHDFVHKDKDLVITMRV